MMKHTFKTPILLDFILKDTRIDIWQYPLHTEFEGARTLLNDDETTRANRYHFARHQRRFTVARALMRLILARYTQLSPTTLSFSYNSYGKPQLSNKPHLQFNLSHSGDLALLAIGRNFPLGIDVEFFSARPYEGIGKHLFSAKEIEALTQANLKLKPLTFFNIWSQKEAFIKACGMGLSYPTQQFDVPVLSGTPQTIMDTLHDNTWQMTSFMPEVACSAALCYHPAITEIRYVGWDLAQQILTTMGQPTT